MNDFKLEPCAKKYFNYGSMQKQLLSDLVNWINAGADPFFDISDDGGPDFKEIPSEVVAYIDLYKSDPIHIGDKDIGDIAKQLISAGFGQICKKPLYRGVSKQELDGILSKINNGKTKFKRDQSTSFTTNYKIAQKFAHVGGGSIKDEISKTAREAGAVLTVYCKKPLLYLDEFLFYYKIAWNIAGISEIDQAEAVDETSEEEWILPKNFIWKLVDKDKLIFEII